MEQTMTAAEVQSVRQIISNPVVGQDSRVSVSGTDQSMGYLQQKLVAGDNITLSQLNPGSQETLKIDAAGGVGGLTYSVGAIFNPGIQINYDTGYDGPEPGEVLFREQADVTAYLASKGATAFKYIMKVYDNALPNVIRHQVKFYMQPGIHRPQNPLPAGSAAAWDFARLADGVHPKFWVKGRGSLAIYQGPTSTDYYNTWTSMLGDLTVTSYNHYGTATEPPWFTVSGTPFGADNSLVGYYVIANNFFLPRVIIKNTANQIWLNEQGQVAGTTTIRICKPPIIMRNSYDDVTRCHTQMINFSNQSVNTGAANVQFDSFQLDQWDAAGIKMSNGFLGLWGCLFDHAGQKNAFGVNNFGKCLDIRNDDYFGPTGSQLWLLSFRSARKATVPGTSSTPVVEINCPSAFKESSNHSWIKCAFASFNNQEVSQQNCRVDVQGLCMVDADGSYRANFQNCKMSFSTGYFPHNGALRSQGGFVFYDCDLDFPFNNDCFGFDGGLGASYYYLTFIRCRQLGWNQGLRGALGTTPGLMQGIQVWGPRGSVGVSKNNLLLGATTHYKIGWTGGTLDATYTQTQLLGKRVATEQPASQLGGGVVIEDMDDNLTIGNAAQLVLTQPGNLLAFKGHGETVGANVDVTAGGRFRLLSSSGKGCNVKVVPNVLPGVTTTATFDVGYGGIVDPYGDVRVMAMNY